MLSFSKRDEALGFITDDENMSRTEEITVTILTLQRLHDCYSRTIHAWEVFENGDILAFNLIGCEALRPRWQGYISKSKGYIADLRATTIRVRQHLEFFEGMKAGVSHLPVLEICLMRRRS